MLQKIIRLSIIFILMVMVLPEASGQKLEKYYTHRTQEEGDLYFLYPNTDFKNSDDHSQFAFDITYRPDTDSTFFNFTYFTLQPAQADSLLLTAGEKHAAAPTAKLYMDFKKKRWVHRYSADVDYGELSAVFQSATAPSITVFTGGKPLTFVVKQSKWEKYHAALEKIFY
ncbi:hypothetical protein EOM75_03515, partial [Candidatus Falkowbacteria bacterium]|nr:hypothetical protein [Candidatus Falkowbacteria bacterium]